MRKWIIFALLGVFLRHTTAQSDDDDFDMDNLFGDLFDDEADDSVTDTLADDGSEEYDSGFGEFDLGFLEDDASKLTEKVTEQAKNEPSEVENQLNKQQSIAGKVEARTQDSISPGSSDAGIDNNEDLTGQTTGSKVCVNRDSKTKCVNGEDGLSNIRANVELARKIRDANIQCEVEDSWNAKLKCETKNACRAQEDKEDCEELDFDDSATTVSTPTDKTSTVNLDDYDFGPITDKPTTTAPIDDGSVDDVTVDYYKETLGEKGDCLACYMQTGLFDRKQFKQNGETNDCKALCEAKVCIRTKHNPFYSPTKRPEGPRPTQKPCEGDKCNKVRALCNLKKADYDTQYCYESITNMRGCCEDVIASNPDELKKYISGITPEMLLKECPNKSCDPCKLDTLLITKRENTTIADTVVEREYIAKDLSKYLVLCDKFSEFEWDMKRFEDISQEQMRAKLDPEFKCARNYDQTDEEKRTNEDVPLLCMEKSLDANIQSKVKNASEVLRFIFKHDVNMDLLLDMPTMTAKAPKMAQYMAKEKKITAQAQYTAGMSIRDDLISQLYYTNIRFMTVRADVEQLSQNDKCKNNCCEDCAQLLRPLTDGQRDYFDFVTEMRKTLGSMALQFPESATQVAKMIIEMRDIFRVENTAELKSAYRAIGHGLHQIQKSMYVVNAKLTAMTVRSTMLKKLILHLNQVSVKIYIAQIRKTSINNQTKRKAIQAKIKLFREQKEDVKRKELEQEITAKEIKKYETDISTTTTLLNDMLKAMITQYDLKKMEVTEIYDNAQKEYLKNNLKYKQQKDTRLSVLRTQKKAKQADFDWNRSNVTYSIAKCKSNHEATIKLRAIKVEEKKQDRAEFIKGLMEQGEDRNTETQDIIQDLLNQLESKMTAAIEEAKTSVGTSQQEIEKNYQAQINYNSKRKQSYVTQAAEYERQSKIYDQKYTESGALQRYCCMYRGSRCICWCTKQQYNQRYKDQALSNAANAAKNLGLSKNDYTSDPLTQQKTALEKNIRDNQFKQLTLSNAWIDKLYGKIDPSTAKQLEEKIESLSALGEIDEDKFSVSNNYKAFREMMTEGEEVGSIFNEDSLEELTGKDNAVKNAKRLLQKEKDKDDIEMCNENNNAEVKTLIVQQKEIITQLTTLRNKINRIDSNPDLVEIQKTTDELFKLKEEHYRIKLKYDEPFMLVKGKFGIKNATIVELEKLDAQKIEYNAKLQQKIWNRTQEELNIANEKRRIAHLANKKIDSTNTIKNQLMRAAQIDERIKEVGLNFDAIKQVVDELDIWTARIKKYTELSVITLLRTISKDQQTVMNNFNIQFGLEGAEKLKNTLTYTKITQSKIENGIKSSLNLFIKFVVQAQVLQDTGAKLSSNVASIRKITARMADATPRQRAFLVKKLKIVISRHSKKELASTNSKQLTNTWVTEAQTEMNAAGDTTNKTMASTDDTLAKELGELRTLTVWAQSFGQTMKEIKDGNFTAFNNKKIPRNETATTVPITLKTYPILKTTPTTTPTTTTTTASLTTSFFGITEDWDNILEEPTVASTPFFVDTIPLFDDDELLELDGAMKTVKSDKKADDAIKVVVAVAKKVADQRASEAKAELDSVIDKRKTRDAPAVATIKKLTVEKTEDDDDDLDFDDFDLDLDWGTDSDSSEDTDSSDELDLDSMFDDLNFDM